MKNRKNLIVIGSIVIVLGFILILFLINSNKEMATYEVAFIIDEGDIIDTQTIIEGEKAIRPSDPEKEGYAFIEWTYQNETYDFSKEVTSDLELIAKWTKDDADMFNVKFDSDGGTTIPNQVIEKGQKVEEPDEPTKNGYIFKGWTLDGEKYNFEAEVTKDLELKAEWEKIQNDSNSSNKDKDSNNKDSNNKDNNNSINNNNNNSKDDNSSNVKVEEETSVPAPVAPTLATPMGGPGFAELSIVYKGVYADGTSEISGYELYEKNGSKYTLIHTSETKFSEDVTVDVGESKTYVARVYTYNKSKVKVYSKYSNEVKVSNPAPEAPTLATPMGGPGFAELSIVYKGVYADGTSGISGYELYEKNGSKYTLIHTSETKFSEDVTVDVGESKTYVARVYTYNKSKEKIYSKYSNELKIDNPAPEAPTLATPMGGPGFAQLSIVYKGAYADGTSGISGYELYEKSGSKYTLIHTSESQFNTDVTVDIGESKTYVARVYTYNKSNVKVYSKYSNEVVINNQ